MADKFHDMDIDELAAHLVGLEINDDYDMDDIHHKIHDTYGIDMDMFAALINDLTPLLDMAVSPLTEEPLIGFGNGSMWLAKKPFKGFINAVIQWMNGDNVKSGKSNGFERTITKGGKPEFKLYLVKADTEVKITKKKSNNGN
jgi:hypothetical protein